MVALRLAILALVPQALLADCGDWHSAALTTYESYPDLGSEECLAYNGCTWAGQFYGLPEPQSEDWVASNNIVAVHEKDWNWLGLKVLEVRQGDLHVRATVFDLCADTDCDGCCTANLGGDGYLVDMEVNTAARFGASGGIVDFRVCDSAP